jgi:hypothetical protein
MCCRRRQWIKHPAQAARQAASSERRAESQQIRFWVGENQAWERNEEVARRGWGMRLPLPLRLLSDAECSSLVKQFVCTALFRSDATDLQFGASFRPKFAARRVRMCPSGFCVGSKSWLCGFYFIHGECSALFSLHIVGAQVMLAALYFTRWCTCWFLMWPVTWSFNSLSYFICAFISALAWNHEVLMICCPGGFLIFLANISEISERILMFL